MQWLAATGSDVVAVFDDVGGVAFWHGVPWVSPVKNAAEAAGAEVFDSGGGAEDSVAFDVEGGDVFTCPKLDFT